MPHRPTHVRTLSVEGRPDRARPAWRDVSAALRRLDGRTRTTAMLFLTEDAYLAVGGGPDRFLVFATDDNLTFHYLLRPGRRRGGEVSLVIGGQRSDYAASRVVNRDVMLRAARTYFHSGARDPELKWEED